MLQALLAKVAVFINHQFSIANILFIFKRLFAFVCDDLLDPGVRGVGVHLNVNVLLSHFGGDGGRGGMWHAV